MLISDEEIKILCCPKTKLSLALIASDTLKIINQAIEQGEVKYRTKEPVLEQIDGGLMRSDGKFIYPIKDGIPILLIDEGIAVNTISKL
jgi:uncharacterized protein YbaR (Trm112 family)